MHAQNNNDQGRFHRPLTALTISFAVSSIVRLQKKLNKFSFCTLFKMNLSWRVYFVTSFKIFLLLYPWTETSREYSWFVSKSDKLTDLGTWVSKNLTEVFAFKKFNAGEISSFDLRFWRFQPLAQSPELFSRFTHHTKGKQNTRWYAEFLLTSIRHCL